MNDIVDEFPQQQQHQLQLKKHATQLKTHEASYGKVADQPQGLTDKKLYDEDVDESINYDDDEVQSQIINRRRHRSPSLRLIHRLAAERLSSTMFNNKNKNIYSNNSIYNHAQEEVSPPPPTPAHDNHHHHHHTNTHHHCTPFPTQVQYDAIVGDAKKQYYTKYPHQKENHGHGAGDKFVLLFLGQLHENYKVEQLQWTLLMCGAGYIPLFDFKHHSSGTNTKKSSCCFTVAVPERDVSRVERFLTNSVMLDIDAIIHTTPRTAQNVRKAQHNADGDLFLKKECHLLNNITNLFSLVTTSDEQHSWCPDVVFRSTVQKFPKALQTVNRASEPKNSVFIASEYDAKEKYENRYSPTCDCKTCQHFFFHPPNMHHHLHTCKCYNCFQDRLHHKAVASFNTVQEQQHDPLLDDGGDEELSPRIPCHSDGEKMVNLSNVYDAQVQVFRNVESFHQQQRQKKQDRTGDHCEDNNTFSVYCVPTFCRHRLTPTKYHEMTDTKKNIRTQLKQDISWCMKWCSRLCTLTKEDYYSPHKHSIADWNLDRQVRIPKQQKINTNSATTTDDDLSTVVMGKHTRCRFHPQSYHSQLETFLKSVFESDNDIKCYRRRFEVSYSCVVEVLNLFKGREEFMIDFLKEIFVH